MIPSILALFTIIVATESSATEVAFSELTLASIPSVGVGMTKQLVADAFTLLDLDGNQELSVDEMAPVILPLVKIFAAQFLDDSGEYVLQERFVHHLYVPDLSAVSGSVGASTCAADSMLVNLDSSSVWTEVFGDAAHVEIESFAETVYNIMAEDQLFTLADLERMMMSDLPTETPSATLLDEYTVGNENCPNSDDPRRNLFLSSCSWPSWGPIARFGLVTAFSSIGGCVVESQIGDDCTDSWGQAGRAVGVGFGLGALQEGTLFFMQRYSIWPFIPCPVYDIYDIPLEPVVYGIPRSPIVVTPPGGPGNIDPADFEVPDIIEAPEIGIGAGEGAAIGAGEGVAIGAGEVAGAGAVAVAAEGTAAGWGISEVGAAILGGLLMEG